MVRSASLFATLLSFILTVFSFRAHAADILFEGYSKILSGGVHVGYIITRYEFDPKSKQFRGIYFLKTGALASAVTESVKSVADQDLNPVSYERPSWGKPQRRSMQKFAKPACRRSSAKTERTKQSSAIFQKALSLATFWSI
jgi:hypothetical protein